MNLKFTKNRIALPVCLALAASALAVGCAGNDAKKNQTAEIKPSAPVITISQSEASVKDTALESKQEKVKTEVVQGVENSTAAVSTYPDIDLSENSQPEQLIFQFSFDKSELSDKDKQIVIQHARYLFDNPEMILKIQGHTDHYGSKAYNEYLSKKRSDAVAKILIEEGIQESQLKIVAMANEAPLADIEDTRMNRRVELEYSEINLVSTN